MNFNTADYEEKVNKNLPVTFTQSGVVKKDGRSVAYARFERGSDFAEWLIPDCTLVKNQGFDAEEEAQMEQYIRENLLDIKKKATEINQIKNLLR